MTRKRPIAASILTLTTVFAFTGISPAHAAPSIIFELNTVVDATSVGGSSADPLRLLYQYDLTLAPGSGPFGSSEDGTYESYAPLRMVIVDVGNECAFLAGDGTSTTVFNNAGTTFVEDSFDVRAEGAALDGRHLFGRDLTLARMLLVDSDATMFTSTALPTSPAFADDSDFQQTTIELIHPMTNEQTILAPGNAPYFLGIFDPQDEVAALQDDVRGAQLSASIVKDLLKPLEEAHALLGTLTQENVDEAAKELQKFIKIVETNRAKKIPEPTAGALGGAAQLTLDSLPRGCV